MRKKILVTGGSGYKGNVLISKLIKNNYSVINVDKNLFGRNTQKSKFLKNYSLDILDFNS